MKIPVLFIFFNCIFIAAAAQATIQTLTVKGIAIDSATNIPLGYVTVALVDAKTQQSVRGTLTKDDGSFELKSIAGKSYVVVFAAVGYAGKVVRLNETGAEVNLGQVLILPSKNQLKEVSIRAVKPIMKREVDRVSYNVQADPENVAITALDMVRKVPMLSVDGNDNIMLKGSGKYKILIDGRESALIANSPGDFLKSVPASTIERIEVITTPPAKYDAEGLAGIINIIMKRNTGQGYEAGISGVYFYNRASGTGVAFDGSIKKGKLGIRFSGLDGGLNNSSAGFGGTQTFFGGQSIIQNGSASGTRVRKHGAAELAYEIDSLNLLTGSFTISKKRIGTNEGHFSNTLNYDGSVAQQFYQNSDYVANFNGIDASINYQAGFKKNKDQLLTLSYQYSYEPGTFEKNYLFSQRVNDFLSAQPDFDQSNNSGGNEHTAQVDYAQPFKKISLEAGAKAIFRDDYSDFNRSELDSGAKQYHINPLYTDNFNYRQQVYSVYSSVELKIEKWTTKAGLRLERTNVNGDFSSANAIITQGYYSLVPSLAIQRNFKTSSINFGFTQRIQRPNIDQLNPFVDKSDPQFISTGNPSLHPELSNNFEISYSNFAKNSFDVGLSYQFSNNAIQQITSLKVDSTANNMKDTVTATTYQNIGSDRMLSFNFDANVSVTKNFGVSLNGQVAKVWLKGFYNGQFYKNSGLTGNVSTDLTYKFDGGYRVSLNAGFISANVNLQGSKSGFVYNSLVFTKTFLGKKANISLLINNPESKYRRSSSNKTTAQFNEYSYNLDPYRTIGVRVSYRFGKLNSELKKNQHGINNDDVNKDRG